MKQTAIYSLSLAYLAGQTSAHGCGSWPPARNWVCSGRGAIPNLGIDWNGANGPNVCKQENHSENINAVMVDWSSIGAMEAFGHSDTAAYQEDPRKPHIDVMRSGISKMMPTNPDGMNAKVCSGNMVRWHALDDPMFRRDQGGWDALAKINPDFEIKEYPTKMKNGKHDFIYTCSAPHRTTGKGYVDNYITKDNVDLDKELTWDDFEPEPICSYMPPSYPSPMQQTGQPSQWHHINSEKYECTIPENKLGDHVILRIWQRDDTGEAFYDCGDVILSAADGSEPSEPTEPSESTQTPSEETETVSESPVEVTESISESTETASLEVTESTEDDACCTPCQNNPTVSPKMTKKLFNAESKIETYDGNCLSDNGSTVKVISCNNAPAWEKFSTNLIRKVNHDLCWEIKDKKLKNLSHNLQLAKCKNTKVNQGFMFDEESGKIRAFMDDRYCASIKGDTVKVQPCDGISSYDDKMRACFGIENENMSYNNNY